METIKKRVKDYWDSAPCCSKAASASAGTKEFFQQVDSYKDAYEPFTDKIADYAVWKDKRVLEIGCGLGKDFARFILNGAKATAIDFSPESLKLTARRLEIFGLKGNLCVADAENLPFKDNAFDLLFSWGVLHHTPETRKAVGEIRRCLKPQKGKAIVMLYNKISLVNLKFRLDCLFSRPRQATREELFGGYTDGRGNPLSRAYSIREAMFMFSGFGNIHIRAYESRASSFVRIFRFFPALERYFGWFMVIEAQK
jgi:ubiquinone/menaquinone biosynthesis C-methylase UbiE